MGSSNLSSSRACTSRKAWVEGCWNRCHLPRDEKCLLHFAMKLLLVAGCALKDWLSGMAQLLLLRPRALRYPHTNLHIDCWLTAEPFVLAKHESSLTSVHPFTEGILKSSGTTRDINETCQAEDVFSTQAFPRKYQRECAGCCPSPFGN